IGSTKPIVTCVNKRVNRRPYCKPALLSLWFRMSEQATKTQAGTSVSTLRCIGCGRTALADRFRCEHCRDLLEIIYPSWDDGGPGGLQTGALKTLWRDRRSSLDPIDQSGVWR